MWHYLYEESDYQDAVLLAQSLFNTVEQFAVPVNQVQLQEKRQTSPFPAVATEMREFWVSGPPGILGVKAKKAADSR